MAKAVSRQASNVVAGVEPAAAKRIAPEPLPDLSHLAKSPTPPQTAIDTEPPDASRLLFDADKSSFLTALRSAITDGTSAELAGTGWTAEQCPYIEHWFTYYASRSAGEVERALRKYAPAAVAATTLGEYVQPVVERVRVSVARWRASGDVDAPTIELPAAEVQMVALGPGRPLDSSLRSRMEDGVGGSLGGVRVHTSSMASQFASSEGASAVTVGQHVAFAGGQFRPGTIAGDALLAHELAHTRQQAEATATRSGPGPDVEQDADIAAGVAVGRLRGMPMAVPKVRRDAGLALRRCGGPTPREFDDEHQFEDQREGEVKQDAWLRRFRADYPTLENAVLVSGDRDDGIEAENGIRIPQVKGHLLKPRKFYEHRFAAFFAYQGAIHYAELIEKRQFQAATVLANETLSSYGEQVPRDNHLHLEKFVDWATRARQAAEAVQAAMMVAEGSQALLGKSPKPPVVPRGSVNGTTVERAVVAGEIETSTAPRTPTATAEPKVIVDPELQPKPTESTVKPAAAEPSRADAKPSGSAARPDAPKYRPCFVAGTQVETIAAPCPIEGVVLGADVLGRGEDDPDGAIATTIQTVAAIHRSTSSDVVRVRALGSEVICTRSHPFRVRRRGWVEAVNLVAGDILESLDSSGVEIDAVLFETLDAPVPTFNLRVPGSRTYFVRLGAHAVLVHNGGPDDFSKTLYWFFGKEPRVRASGSIIDTDGLSVWRTDSIEDVNTLFDSRVNQSNRKTSDPHGYFTEDQLKSADMVAPKTPGDPKNPLTGQLDHHSVRPATNADPKTDLSTPEIEQLDGKLKQIKTPVVKPSQLKC